jgi:hypothetical protein
MTSDLPASGTRDLRLDFFRGLALLLIFVAHMPDNWLAQYRPGAFGFSDSADIFVFVSGSAAAFAYGPAFRRVGFIPGTARILRRCAQLYVGHLGLFFTVAALCVAGNRLLATNIDYIESLNLWYFFEHTEQALVGLYTLTYVPNYFDILPMYIVALAMLPLVMLFARLHSRLAALVCIALYVAVPLFKLELPAEISFNRPWFFNPFSWQLLFFTGLFLSAGWLKAPPVRRWLVVFCAVFLILSVPLSHYPTYSHVAWLKTARMHLEPFVTKSDLGILRWLHLLCLAYLATALLKGREHIFKSNFAAPFIKTGQQALPVFLSGMALSVLAGMALDVIRRNMLSIVLVNGAGIGILMLIAYLVSWFKSQPWRPKARQ